MVETELTFEKAFERLEEITHHLEQGEVSLDESLSLFEEGMKLSRWCSKKLENAKHIVEMLVKGEDGQWKEVPFEDQGET